MRRDHMLHTEAPGPCEIAAIWFERFGQPPPILTDPELMLSVMSSLPPLGGDDTTP